ncbi:MAG: DNA polymerase III subunit chi [Rickettsiales bacterium]|jgi:DNA polymerase-3 subunit chi
MTAIQFYHLTATPLERALPKLLERALSGGYRVCLVANSDARVEQLNQLLWTYDAVSFLPHGSDKDEQPEIQPILLSTNAEPLNDAKLLLITDGRSAGDEKFERVLDIFDGNDPQATVAARNRWAEYKKLGHELTYFSQNKQGGWQKKG